MNEKLDPCPVCGASRGLYVFFDETDLEWYVFCDCCKTKVGNERNETKKDAIRLWNGLGGRLRANG